MNLLTDFLYYWGVGWAVDIIVACYVVLMAWPFALLFTIVLLTVYCIRRSYRKAWIIYQRRFGYDR
jgi:hypothetical protein